MFTKQFSKLSKKDSDIAGGKGASLGEMINAGIPVPDGFVVLATTFDEFLHKADLIQEIDAILESVDHKAVHSIDAASEKIQELIKHATMPVDIASEIESQFEKLDSDFVAVRSSATAEDGADHAWAGQLDSYLNTTKDALLEKVQHCWASLFTPRAIFYRFEKGLHTTKISVAVVIQKMVNSEKSGIAFSVHPVTEDRNQIIIEAGFGLGEAIVSGSITPDSYVIEKEPRKIVDINVSTQTRALYRKIGGGNEWQDIGEKGGTQVFREPEILSLAEIVMTIENHYGFPCDIEWAYENGEFYIVQSRPITTLSAEKEANNDPAKKPYYYKAYTRDTSLILQKAWILAVSKLYETLKGNSYAYPPIIMYLFDGTIEIYDNEEFDKELATALLLKNKQDSNFFNSYVDPFLEEIPFFEKLWEKGKVESVDELKMVLDRWNKQVERYVVYYLSQYDAASPEFILEKGRKIRETDEVFARTDKALRQSLQFLYPELIGVENAILQEEIKHPPTKEELLKRQGGFVFTGDDNHIQPLRELPYSFESLADKAIFVKGQIGFKGKVQGKVFILKRNSDVDMVQDGDIIVSPMTTPEHVPAMKKASAFVTDEGGITCHAAIIAREMKKPCIIGTKHATEIFKNGDLVEVDADNGIIRLIS
jgi:phosphoenolpyruvate synthase/pyruvate phosphate dikinase